MVLSNQLNTYLKSALRNSSLVPKVFILHLTRVQSVYIILGCVKQLIFTYVPFNIGRSKMPKCEHRQYPWCANKQIRQKEYEHLELKFR